MEYQIALIVFLTFVSFTLATIDRVQKRSSLLRIILTLATFLFTFYAFASTVLLLCHELSWLALPKIFLAALVQTVVVNTAVIIDPKYIKPLSLWHYFFNSLAGTVLLTVLYSSIVYFQSLWGIIPGVAFIFLICSTLLFPGRKLVKRYKFLTRFVIFIPSFVNRGDVMSVSQFAKGDSMSWSKNKMIKRDIYFLSFKAIEVGNKHWHLISAGTDLIGSYAHIALAAKFDTTMETVVISMEPAVAKKYIDDFRSCKICKEIAD